MSHFTVLVIGPDVDKQLRPFHEFECTGYNDEYVENIDKLSELKAEFANHKHEGEYSYVSLADFAENWHGSKVVYTGEEPDIKGYHKFGWARVTLSGDVTEYIDRTNPNAKWDWYQIGGRWKASLLLKDGTRADEATKGEVDWKAMGSFGTFAVVKDGQWYEKGEMGYWAMVSNAKGEPEWSEEYSSLLDSVSDDTMLTIVDCHI